LLGLKTALSLKGEEFLLTRADSYIGVMIDDLIKSGALEPYRMFTSRSEYRLSLRADNADIRLTEKGYGVGSVSEKQMAIFRSKTSEIEGALSILKEAKFTPHFCKQRGLEMAQDGVKRSAFSLLSYPHVTLEQIKEFIPELKNISPAILQQVLVEAKYHKYLARQEDDIKMFQKNAKLKIPSDFDFSNLPGLSLEIREKVKTYKPENVSELSNIPGVTPAAITAILVYLTKLSFKETA